MQPIPREESKVYIRPEAAAQISKIPMKSSALPATERVTLNLKRLVFENHDHCVSCKYAFKEADTSFAGYGVDDEPLYVCGTCAATKLKETARRTYFMAREYQVPDPTAVLWRYMDFTKYVSLLSTKSLYFPNAACFDDTFEGAKGLVERKQEWDEFYLNFFRQAVRSAPRSQDSDDVTEEEVEKNAQRLIREMEAAGTADREQTFISCWHESKYESEAMWKLYSTSISHALAIQTTVGATYAALGRSPDISIGRVKYLDYETSFASVNGAFWRKRKSFEHEREVRLLIQDHRQKTDGIAIRCEIPTLIQSVIVSPKTPGWFLPLAGC